MLPEILLGRHPDPALERRGVARHDVVGVALAVAGANHLDALESESVPSIGLSDGSTEHDGDIHAQPEYRRTLRRLRQAAEERDERRCESEHTLIGEKRDEVSLLQRSRRL